jgi:hypothetical protein
MYGYIRGKLLSKLKLNSSLRCIEIRVHNVGVKNVSVECNRRRVYKLLVLKWRKEPYKKKKKEGENELLLNKLIKQ